MPTRTNVNNIIVFSQSPEERDFIRDRINEAAMNAVCFESEAICFDNIRALAPGVVIVQTDSRQVAWRFVFALDAVDIPCPLVLASGTMNVDGFLNNMVKVPIYTVAHHRENHRLMDVVTEASGYHPGKSERDRLPLFLGQAKPISRIRAMIPSIADSGDCVLITGENGTGKELLARLIVKSGAKENLFIKIDCEALSSEMQLNKRLQKVFMNRAGSKAVTIFLDGLQAMSGQMQAEVLLAMEDIDEAQGRYGVECCRYLATSRIPVQTMVAEGRFRKDLFYRLNVIPIFLPPLRARREDISMLMDYFTIDTAVGNGKSTLIPSQKARDTLYMYDWPGNVEELKSYMRRLSTSGDESCIFANTNMPTLKKSSQAYFLKSASIEGLPKSHEIKRFLPIAGELSLKRICEEFVSRTEKKLMQKALESTNWNRKKAAKLLNISYKSMLNKMKAYDII